MKKRGLDSFSVSHGFRLPFPPLQTFTGDKVEVEENSFKYWMEKFEERALLFAWSPEQKLYRLKLHLTGTALQVFKLFPKRRVVTILRL